MLCRGSTKLYRGVSSYTSFILSASISFTYTLVCRWLGNATFQDTFGAFANQGYEHGRAWLAGQVGREAGREEERGGGRARGRGGGREGKRRSNRFQGKKSNCPSY